MNYSQAQAALSAAMNSNAFADVSADYRRKGIDIASGLRHAESVLMTKPEGLSEDQWVTLIISLLQNYLKQATRKPPTTFLGRLIRSIMDKWGL